MKYKIVVKHFIYVPEEDKRYNKNNEGVIWSRSESKKVNSLKEVLQNAMEFVDTYKSVKPDEGFENTLLYLISDTESDKPGHKDYYYTERSIMDVTFM